MGRIGKRMLIKGNLMRNDDPICGEVETLIYFVVGRIAEENAFGGMR